jgi:Tn3 transposase DDE domain
MAVSSRPSTILRYIQEEDLRRGVQLQLNRGEHRHILAKWLFFANRGEFRDGDINEIMNKTSCLSLLSNAVVIWNTIHMQKIVDRLRGAGQAVKEEDLARNWPLLHTHIIPTECTIFPASNATLDFAYNTLTSKNGLLCLPVLLPLG